jgi:hypothetical protein
MRKAQPVQFDKQLFDFLQAAMVAGKSVSALNANLPPRKVFIRLRGR